MRRDYGVLTRAIVAGASGQLRNKATTAGNLLQRTRCPYFYDTNQAVQQAQARFGLRRDRRIQPPAGRDRHQRRLHRHLSRRHGGGAARARCDGGNGQSRRQTRAIPIAEFHRLPGDTPHIETALQPGELITAVTLPRPIGGTHAYHKVRDRASYAFALVSVAAVIQPDGSARFAVGGVAPKPWRVEAAEAQLGLGAKAASAQLMAGARPTEENAFKVPLVERTLAAVMAEARA